jgi:hypothetical protein
MKTNQSKPTRRHKSHKTPTRLIALTLLLCVVATPATLATQQRSARATGYVTVAGRVFSYNPCETAHVALTQGGVTKYETQTILNVAPHSQVQTFTFTNVAPGDYTLYVTKPTHTNLTVKTVHVGYDDLSLPRDSHPTVAILSLRDGDINGDGLINDFDLTILLRKANYNQPAAKAANPECDLNGDGLINDEDLEILWSPDNYQRGPMIIETTDALSSASLTLETAAGDACYVSLMGEQLTKAPGSTYTLTYDTSKLRLTDFAAQTGKSSIAAGAIADTGIDILSHLGGTVTFRVNRAAEEGTVWSGVLTVIRFDALASGSAGVVLS